MIPWYLAVIWVVCIGFGAYKVGNLFGYGEGLLTAAKLYEKLRAPK